MSYVLAFLGFVALIVLHEAGHFVAAKAVGMRVERFSLFMGPLLVKFRRGETEYGIGPLPLGGYVRITGMNPHEEIPPEVVPRAYYNQPVWKRVVVILAGPAVNLLIAFVIVWALVLSAGQSVATTKVAGVVSGSPAAKVLRPGDQVVSVDGVTGSEAAIRAQIDTHRCAGAQVNGCVATTPAKVVIRRDGQLLTLEIRPQYNASAGRPLIGVDFGTVQEPVGVFHAASITGSQLWSVTTQTVSTVARIFEPQERKQLHSIVYGYTATQQSFATSTTQALWVLALISLSLGIINLFPFLPLDGGHVFWAVAEKLRGKRIPFEVMERAGVVGFVLIVMIFVIGLTNDISTLSGPGINLH
ncbi:MAG TPA: site-2 protease family protein [Solirubrobacteraceae bacterium]|nr:site-2 protease family protein [Solirubrobacteraceae bacterium]